MLTEGCGVRREYWTEHALILSVDIISRNIMPGSFNHTYIDMPCSFQSFSVMHRFKNCYQ